MDTPTIKQKLSRSRSLASTLKNRVFMSTLYKLLDEPSNQSIMTWDTTGVKILIKDEEKLIKEIFPKFERCITLINFFRRMEECRFFETLESDLGAVYVFENLFFTRDKRPILDIELKKRVNKQPEEEHPLTKKVHKPVVEEIQQDLRTLMNFEQILQQQVNHRVQFMKSKIAELDSDLQLAE